MGKKNALTMILNQIFMDKLSLKNWDYLLDKYVATQKIKNISQRNKSSLKGNIQKQIINSPRITWNSFVLSLKILQKKEFQIVLRTKDPLGKIKEYAGDWRNVDDELDKELTILSEEEEQKRLKEFEETKKLKDSIDSLL